MNEIKNFFELIKRAKQRTKCKISKSAKEKKKKEKEGVMDER